MIEVDRPNRQARRRHGKSDSSTPSRRPGRRCRAGAAGSPRPPTATSKRSGCCWSPSARGARPASSASTRSAISASAHPMSCGNGSVTCPSPALAATRPRAAPRPDGDAVVYATKLAMQTLGRRVLDLDAELDRLDDELAEPRRARPPRACSTLHGVGVDTAAIVARRRRRQRRTDQLRSRLRAPLRRRPDPRVVRQDHPAPAQPRRQPPSQPRPVADRVHPHELRPTHPRLRRNAASPRAAPSREIIRVLKRYVAREIYRHLPRS